MKFFKEKLVFSLDFHCISHVFVNTSRVIYRSPYQNDIQFNLKTIHLVIYINISRNYNHLPKMKSIGTVHIFTLQNE